MTITIQNWTRVSQQNPCPVCGHPDWCEVSIDSETIHCMRISSPYPSAYRMGGWFHYLSRKTHTKTTTTTPTINTQIGSPRFPKLSLIKPDPFILDNTLLFPTQTFEFSGQIRKKEEFKKEKADTETLNKVYSFFLDNLSLSPQHLNELTSPKRNFSQEQIERRCYKSFPFKGRETIAKKLLEKFGLETLQKIPGFYLRTSKNGNKYPSLTGPEGLLIPIKNLQNQIIGFQIKADNTEKSKYCWFSSKGKEQGTSSGAPIHISFPKEKKSDEIWITEGPIKADIISDILGVTVIAIPGVGNWNQLELFQAIRKLDPSWIIIAYDMDSKKNPHVKSNKYKLAASCLAMEYPIYFAKWNPNEGKGVDDLFLNKGKYQLIPFNSKKRFEKISSHVVTVFSLEKEFFSLEVIRETIANKVKEIILTNKPNFTLISSTVGTGKTQTTLETIFSLKDTPQLKNKKILFVTDSKKAYEQWKELSNEIYTREGRSPNLESKWYCFKFELAEDLAKSRHSPWWDLCGKCKEEFDEENWNCPYVESLKEIKDKKVIFAPKPAIFNASKELNNFDIIIIDEEASDLFIENSILTKTRLKEYLKTMEEINKGSPEKYHRENSFRKIIKILEKALEIPVSQYNWLPAIPKLKEIGENIGIIFENLVKELKIEKPNPKTKRYDFEKPLELQNKEKRIIPLRYFHDLIEALSEEIDGHEDTRIWLTPQGLKIYKIRTHLLKILEDKIVINLNATPSPLIYKFFPNLEEIHLDTNEFFEVTQFVDILFTRNQIKRNNYRYLEKLNKVMDEVTKNAKKPVIFTIKEFNPNIEDKPFKVKVSNPNTKYGHFDFETKALNDFSDCDVLCLVGHYSHPISELRALAQAVRFKKTLSMSNFREISLKPYFETTQNKTSLARYSRVDPDPLVQKLIEHSEEATITQAIGRGRPLFRNKENSLKVYLFTSMPIKYLPIKEITTITQFFSEQKYQSPLFTATRIASNYQKKKEAEEKIKKAIEKLRKEGIPVTKKAIQKETGCSWTTLSKNNPPPLHTGAIYYNNITFLCVDPRGYFPQKNQDKEEFSQELKKNEKISQKIDKETFEKFSQETKELSEEQENFQRNSLKEVFSGNQRVPKEKEFSLLEKYNFHRDILHFYKDCSMEEIPKNGSQLEMFQKEYCYFHKASGRLEFCEICKDFKSCKLGSCERKNIISLLKRNFNFQDSS